MANIFQTTFDHATFPDQHGRVGHHWEVSDYCKDYRGPSNTPGYPYPGPGRIRPNLCSYTRPPGGPNQPTGDDAIITAANNPNGGGGKGFRHWVGDGKNNGGGHINIVWATTPEFWIRYYIRFEAGFAWQGGGENMKTIYVQQTLRNGFYFGLHGGVIGGSNGTILWHSTVTWEEWMGGDVGDGQWHCLELHVKMNNPATAFNAIFEFWLNGKQIYRNTATRMSTVAGHAYNWSQIGSNHARPLNGRDVYVDFDDIAVSDSGYIGLLSALAPDFYMPLRVTQKDLKLASPWLLASLAIANPKMSRRQLFGAVAVAAAGTVIPTLIR